MLCEHHQIQLGTPNDNDVHFVPSPPAYRTFDNPIIIIIETEKPEKLPFWAEVKSLSSHIPHVHTELSIYAEINRNTST